MDLQPSDEIRPLAGIVALELPQNVRMHRNDRPLPIRRHPLILAPHDDLHAAAVYWGLVRNGIGPLWSASLAENVIGPISLHSDGFRKWRHLPATQGIKIGGRRVLRRRARGTSDA